MMSPYNPALTYRYHTCTCTCTCACACNHPHVLLQCYQNKGATEISQPGRTKWLTLATLAECIEQCQQQSECTAVTSSRKPPLRCYLRSHVDIERCLVSPKMGYDTSACLEKKSTLDGSVRAP